MKFKLTARASPQNREAAPKYYATPVYAGEKNLKQLSREIAKLSSLSPGDVYNVLINLVGILPKHMSDGFKVSPGDFGTFKPSFSSQGVEDLSQFNVSMIRGRKVIYRAGKDVNTGMAGMHFTKEG